MITIRPFVTAAVVMTAMTAPNLASATVPPLTWQNTYGTGQEHSFYDLVSADTDGVYAVGSRFNSGTGEDEAWLARVDADGNLLWQEFYGEPNDEIEAFAAARAGDDIVLAGRIDGDVWVARLDNAGNLLWQEEYGTGGIDVAFDVAVTGSGASERLWLAGRWNGSGLLGGDGMVLELNANGILLNAYPYSGSVQINSITPTTGGVLLAGEAAQGSNRQAWTALMDPTDGSLDWTHTDGGAGRDVAMMAIEGLDGDVVVVGERRFSGDPRVWLYKLDALNGSLIWSRDYGTAEGDEYGRAVTVWEDGYMVLAEADNFQTQGEDVWLVGTNSMGNQLWTEVYASSQQQSPEAWLLNGDGLFVAGEQEGGGPERGLLMKFAADQNISELSVEVIPTSLTDLPAAGGMLEFTVTLENTTPNAFQGQAWSMVTLPNGNEFGPLVVAQLTLPNGIVVASGLTQNVPGFAPDGSYTFMVNLGVFNSGTVLATDSFGFTKSGVTTGVNDWDVRGWDSFDSAAGIGSAAAQPAEFSLGSAYPNPFNPTTSLNVALPVASDLRVVVYNSVGQQVAELASGMYSAGTHNLSFDGSNLASGLYFVRAVVPGQLNAMQKVMLVK